MDEYFWQSIEQKEISEDFLKNFDKIFRDKIIKMSNVIYQYFQKNNPKDSKFYDNPDDYYDYYDGIHLSSESLFELMYSIIVLGDEKFDQFCEIPFDGNIMNYLEHGISCGNSSCLYFRKISMDKLSIMGSKNNQENSDDDTSVNLYYPDDVDFLNQIFDIIIEPYL